MTTNGVRVRSAAGLSAAVTPVLYTCAFLLLMIVWRVFGLPEPDQVYQVVIELFEEHGLVIVAVCAFVEGIVLVNLYFPGSAVIVIGVAAAGGDIPRVVAVVAVTTVAFVLASQVNYFVGFLGLHTIIERFGGTRWLQAAHKRYEKHGILVVPPSFVHPNIGAFMSVTCGLARMTWRHFTALAVASILVWNILWGIVAFYGSNALSEAATRPAYLLLAFAVWCLGAFLLGFARPGKRANRIHGESREPASE